MIACGISLYSYICIVAHHLGTLAETREGCGVGAKLEDGVWWNYFEDGSTRRVVPDKHRLSVGS
jgi:hypothetical protein